jgi:microcin C transport system permease protein
MKLSPITRRRLQAFKNNKRGYYSFWIFALLFCLTIPAEFIANDKPILISYKGGLYFPVLKAYPETTFDGYFLTETNYTDPYIIAKIKANGWIVNPLIPYSYKSVNYKINRAPSPPSAENWLGVDDQGRDVVARLIYGFRLSILFALILTSISSVIGIAVGALQGYFGGLIDLLTQRFIEIWHGLPMLYMLIILSSFVEPNFWWLLLLLLLFSWLDLVSMVRAEFLKVRNYDYVRSARALGVSEFTIMRRHILPNATISAMTYLPFILTGAVTTLTSLDFLGFGLPTTSPSLGELLAQGKTNPTAPWLGITAFVALATLLTLMIFIGEALRDALNPYKATGGRV